MLKAITWCAKCLFLYFLVAIAALRFSWIFTTPVWSIASRMHWTQYNQFVFVLSYFLPIFATAGFILGLIPLGRLGKALGDLYRSISPNASRTPADPDAVPPILWAWLPVTLAFLFRFITWESRNSSVFDARRSPGRIERFFGPLYTQNPALLDSHWVPDRFLFTGPMLFLMACALAVFLRRRIGALGKPQKTTEPDINSI